MRKWIAAASILVLAAGAVAYYGYARTPAAPQVVTAAVTRGDIVEAVGATGTLEALTTVQVGTQVSGTIAELHADFNSVVRKGQVIARLDPSLFATQIEQARANLARSQAEVERLRVGLEDAQTKLRRAAELSARSLIARQELDAAQIDVRTAQAQIRSAQAAVTQARATLNQNEVNLHHTVIAAPIDGIVISRNVDVGQTVAASMQAPTLFVIAADLTKMRVNANVDEADVGRIRPNQRVTFTVDAFPNQEFVGGVSQVRLQPQVVQNVVTYNTVIDVPNPDFRLKPGMTATVNIEIARREDVLRIPNGALRFRPTAEIFAAVGQPVPGESPRGSSGTRADAARAAGRGASPADTRTASAEGRSDGASAVPGATGARPSGAGARQAAPPAQGPGARAPAPRPEANGPPAGGAGASGPGRSPASRDGPGGATWQRAQTVDALFGPIPVQETSGVAWRYEGGRLEAVRLKLGISDAAFTEIVRGDLADGTTVVTSVGVEGAPARAATGQSPLMPQRRSGGPPGVRNASPATR